MTRITKKRSPSAVANGKLRRMFQAAILISGRDWLVPGIIVFVFVLLLLVWSYRSASGGTGLKMLCLFLKLVGVLALAACLLEPLWTRERARPGANYFALLADNSQGMKIKDRSATRSRGEHLVAMLSAEKPSWQPALGENFQVRRYLFDSRLQSTRDFSELLFDGRVSSMMTALRTLTDRYKGQPLAGVLLFTDGNATDLGEGLPDLSGVPPVYPVVMGTDDPIKDVALQRVAVSQTAFEDAPVTIQTEVLASGYSGETLVAQLVKMAQPANVAPSSPTNTNSRATTAPLAATPPKSGVEKVVAEQRQRAARDGEPVSFRFQFKPDQSGLSFYRLQIAPKDDIERLTNVTQSSEATLANNSRVIVVDRGRGPYRILYVSGRPNWEYKFLQRALVEDDQVQLVALMRIARREPKFEFRGRAGESSNPLFRGFGNQSKEEIERYDQPVLVRLNTKDEFELRGGFPKAAEELYPYHAIILDDLEAEFFTPDQMTLLQKFVSERGGGFLMLGGTESFHEGKFHRTPLGDMLPVYLDQTPDPKPPGELRLAFTREGMLQPWARLRNNESDEKRRLDDVAPFGVLNRVRGIKPGASVIATVSDDGRTQYPAIAVQRFGHGHVGAVMIGDIWHWGLKDEANHRDMDKAWRQLSRWLVADVPNRTELQVEQKPGDPNQAVRLQVRVRDKKFQPLDNATVTVHVRPVGQVATNIIRLTAEPMAAQAGVYETTYVPRDTGGYHAEAVVTDTTGMEVGRGEGGWTSDPAAEEFRSLKPNRALLEAIAKRTGGEVIAATALDTFARGLPNRKVPITESSTSPLWHQAAVFLFALACFVAEWGLRRWKGLA